MANKIKSVTYSKEITLAKLKKEIKSFVKYSDDCTIYVQVWDYTDYRHKDKEEVEMDCCSLYLEVYVTLNDQEDDNTKCWFIVDISQNDLPQEQFEATATKLLKEAKKLAKSLEEFNDRCRYEDDENDEEIEIEQKTEIITYDHTLVC